MAADWAEQAGETERSKAAERTEQMGETAAESAGRTAETAWSEGARYVCTKRICLYGV